MRKFFFPSFFFLLTLVLGCSGDDDTPQPSGGIPDGGVWGGDDDSSDDDSGGDDDSLDRKDVSEGEICGVVEDDQGTEVIASCIEDLKCVNLRNDDSLSASEGRCYRACDPANPLCSELEYCLKINDETYVCYPYENAQLMGEGEACSGKTDESAVMKICDKSKDLTCALPYEDSVEGICTGKCNPSNNSADCPEGLQCTEAVSADYWCIPPDYGKSQLYESCLSSSRCVEGLVCVARKEGLAESVCLTICDPNAPQCEENEVCLELDFVCDATEEGCVCDDQGNCTLEGMEDVHGACLPLSDDDDDSTAGDDDSTVGDDDVTAADDDSTVADDDSTAGDDDSTAADDDSTTP
jgi:hypothetical protein